MKVESGAGLDQASRPEILGWGVSDTPERLKANAQERRLINKFERSLPYICAAGQRKILSKSIQHGAKIVDKRSGSQLRPRTL